MSFTPKGGVSVALAEHPGPPPVAPLKQHQALQFEPRRLTLRSVAALHTLLRVSGKASRAELTTFLRRHALVVIGKHAVAGGRRECSGVRVTRISLQTAGLN